jgi:DNA primase (bacterial type)
MASTQYAVHKMIEQAFYWLGQGRALVPLQPGTKRIVAGYGAYSKHVVSEAGARFWFSQRRCNLGLVCGGGLVVVDIDNVVDYNRVASGLPATYTERTPRGYHLFFAGDSGSGMVQGVEVLGTGSVVTVTPSEVGGMPYRVLSDMPIARMPPCLSLLSGESSVSQPPRELSKGSVRDDLISRIKAAFSLLDVVPSSTRLSSRDGRWYHGLCPFHDDTSPSFWVDVERGVWGCYACRDRGDVINLYAKLHGLSVQDAITAMAGHLV